jgi:flagellar protein FliS
MDDMRARYLRDRVLTATPAQRVVMLYDRLVLDLTRAAQTDRNDRCEHIAHASQIVAELFGSLDLRAGGPAENLASIYGFLLKELMNLPAGGALEQLTPLIEIATTLRSAWASAAQQSAHDSEVAAEASGRRLVGSWVG